MFLYRPDVSGLFFCFYMMSDILKMYMTERSGVSYNQLNFVPLSKRYHV